MKKYLITVIIIIVVAGIAFYGGLKYGQGETAAITSRGNSQFSQNNGVGSGRFGLANGESALSGQVLNLGADGFTLQTRGGGSRIVLASSSTTVMKSVVGALSDVAVGAEATVVGTANSDGSFTAQSVQIRPASPNPTGQ